MKIILFAVTLNLVAGVFVDCRYPVPAPIKTPTPKPLSCKQSTGASDQQVNGLYKVVPTTRTVKCLHECFMRLDGLLQTDGRINNQQFLKLLAMELDHDKLARMSDVMEKCANQRHLSNDKCENVGVLLLCITIEAKRRIGFSEDYTLTLFCRITNRC